MRWNARIETGDTPRVEELAQKHDCKVEVLADEAADATRVVVEGSKGAVKKLLAELGATDIVEEP